MKKSSAAAATAILTGTLLMASPAIGFAKTFTITRGGNQNQQTQEQTATNETLAGGWQVTSGATSAALTEDELDVFNRAFEGMVGTNLTPVAVIATQLVAGTNYAYLVQVTPVVPNPQPHWAVAVVYRDLEDNVSATSIRDINLADIAVGANPQGLMGGWEIKDAPEAPFMDETVKAAFDDAVSDVEEITFAPVAVLGSQVVDGTNYKVLAVGTNEGEAEEPFRDLFILTINASPYGGASLPGFERPDLAYYTTESNDDVHAVESVGTPASGGNTIIRRK